MGSVNHAQAIKPDTAHIRKLIENGLLGDWIIRIEYENRESSADGWQQWEKSFFALRSADDVLVAIKDCYRGNSDCAIRIHAEKVRPRTRMLHTVYNPHYLQVDAEIESATSPMPYHPAPNDHAISSGVVKQN